MIPYPFQIYSTFFFALYKLTCGVASSFLFSLEGARKRFLFFYNQSFFVISPIKSIPFPSFHGIICGELWGSLAVEDHLRSILGIICGWGSFAVLYSTAQLKLAKFGINRERKKFRTRKKTEKLLNRKPESAIIPEQFLCGNAGIIKYYRKKTAFGVKTQIQWIAGLVI